MDQPISTTCYRSVRPHHHLVHDGGWHLDLHPDRRLVVRRPDGTIAHDDSTVHVAPTGAADVELHAALRSRFDALIA